jgi:hypothetical protein
LWNNSKSYFIEKTFSCVVVDLTMASTNVDPMAHAAAPVSEAPVCLSIA